MDKLSKLLEGKLISKTKESVSEFVKLDAILTQISKTSSLTEQQLAKLTCCAR